MKIKEGIYNVGIKEKKNVNIDGLLNTNEGVSYNSYLIIGKEKSMLIDLVPKEYEKELVKNIEEIIDLKKLDYIVLTSTVLSRSGALEYVLDRTNAKVLISRHGFVMLKEILHRNINPTLISDRSETISLGGKTVEFISAQYLYWPDTIFVYLPEDKIIFTGNFMSAPFYADDMFKDDGREFEEAYISYYKKFLRPFKDYVLEAFNKLEKKDLEMVCPGFGPIIKNHLNKNMETYKNLLSGKKTEKKKAMVFYATSYGGTKLIAENIGSGLTESGVDTEIIDLSKVEINDELIDKIDESDAIIVGSNTVNGDAMRNVWVLLSSLGTINLRNKIGFAFGTYAWSGEAARLIESRMRDIKLKVPEEHFRAMLIPTEDDFYQAREIGKKLADILKYRII